MINAPVTLPCQTCFSYPCNCPYRVIVEKPGCPHCNCGALYMIVFDDEDGEECGTSTSYGGPGVPNDEAREAAEEVADALTGAYQRRFQFSALCRQERPMTSVNAELHHREHEPKPCSDEWHRENHYAATDCPGCGEHWEPGPAVRTRRHLKVSVRGALRNAPGSLRGMYTADDGRELSVDEARELLFDELKKGHEVIPACEPSECPDFDYTGGGCPGHKEE